MLQKGMKGSIKTEAKKKKVVLRQNIITAREKGQINILGNKKNELCKTRENIDQECQQIKQNSKKKKMGNVF